ncbi:MAG: hypothetical protein V4690_01930 [Patescibacteria group bacterium]
MKYFSRALFVVLIGVLVIACDGGPRTPQQSVSGATQAAPDTVPKNSKGNTVEQQNIADRLKVTQDPTKVMWIHLIALDGRILRRMAVRNKVTSSSKRLEPVQAVVVSGDMKSGYYPAAPGGFQTPELIQPDGTHGSSDPYIFWFDPMGRYHQWGTAGGLGYLLTDYPIDIGSEMDEITGLFQMNEAAAKWQAEQESKLRKAEGK